MEDVDLKLLNLSRLFYLYQIVYNSNTLLYKQQIMMKNALLLLFFCGLLVSCGNEPAANTEEATAEKTEEAPQEAAPTTKYKVYPAPEATNYPDAQMKAMAYNNGKFKFSYEGKEYKLGAQTPDAGQRMCANSAKGQHIHLIIDNKPYAAKYEPEFDYDVEDGEHHLLAFLSRSYHESLKHPEAKIAQKITVKDKSITKFEPITTPMLFYSRPKGTYVGKDTEKMLLDFYALNAELGEGKYSVKADINGEVHMLDQWQPYFIEGLPMGENTVTLTLMNADGTPADVPLNPVSRTFTLKADIEKES